MVVCCGGGSDQTVEESKVSIVQSFKVNNTWRPEPLVTIRKLVVRDISEVQRYPGLEQLFNDLDTIFHVSCHNPSPSPSKSESKVQVKSPSQESKSSSSLSPSLSPSQESKFKV